MARTPSTMLPLHTPAPSFSLPDPQGNVVSLQEYANQPVLIAFICNHCPFVIHIREGFAKLAKTYQDKGVAVIAINSNDVEKYPADRPEKMAEEIKDAGYTFPYLFDQSQDVAKRYRAACTPDFYVFDAQHKLVYRGQMDDSRPGNGIPVSGKDLQQALDAVLNNTPVPAEQKPSIGCNIKWIPGNEPTYF
ncbi:MAG: thioredoxin family protein [Myxococcota bacterium]